MIGCNKGYVSFIKEQKENVIVNCCFFDREALTPRTLGEDVKEGLDKVL